MWSIVWNEKMFETIFETNVLTSTISIEKILMFNSSISLLKSFDENVKMIKRFDVNFDEISIVLFWKTNLNNARLKMTITIWRISSSNCTTISFNNLLILLLICVCVNSFERIFKSKTKSKTIIIDFELNASKSRKRLLFFHSTLKKWYMIFFVVIIRYIFVSS